jgi:hypothetical protein
MFYKFKGLYIIYILNRNCIQINSKLCIITTFHNRVLNSLRKSSFLFRSESSVGRLHV